jgi:hypothetical protein
MILDLFFLHRIVGVDWEENKSLLRTISDNSSFNGVVAATVSYAKDPKMPPLLVCKEVSTSVSVVIYTSKNFFLLNAINEKIEDLKASGLIDYWEILSWRRKNDALETTKTPKVLSLKRLIGCIQLFLCGCFLGFVVFIFEILKTCFKK